MALIKIGDWDKLSRTLNVPIMQAAITKHSLIATKRAGKFVVRNIKLQMRRTTSPPNAELTRIRKKSSKPLMDEGDLFGAVDDIVLSPFQVFVGIPGNKQNQFGVNLAMIARVLEGGDIGQRPKDTEIKPKRAKALFLPLKRRVRPYDPGLVFGEDFVLAGSVRIRARPFVGPAVKASRKGVLLIYEDGVRKAFRKLSGV